jgi:hypothetical protein
MYQWVALFVLLHVLSHPADRENNFLYDACLQHPTNKLFTVKTIMGRLCPFLDDWGSILGRGNDGLLLFASASGATLGAAQPPIQWVPVVLFLEVKRPSREADHSPPYSAKVKNMWNYASIPALSSWSGA